MAPFKGFIGGSYQAAARQGDQERSLNFYPEQIQSPGGKTKAEYVLLSRPGLAVFAQFAGASSVRAECELNGRAFAIAQNGPANAFYEVLSNGTSVSYGALPGDRRPQLTPSETEVLVLCGGIGYVFNLAANTLTRIDTEASAPAFPVGATKSGFLDGYGIVLEPNSQTFAISGLNDFTAWDGLDFGDAEGEPGNVVTFIVDHRQVWFFCNNHTEVYYDAGNANFPLVRLDGAFMEQGADSIDGAFQCDNTVFWLGGNRDGRGICWRANGYTPERVSTHAIEALIQSFGDASDVSGYAYQETGHTFARWDFPSANGGLGASILFDVASGFWHERCFWNSTLGVEMADLARTHMFVFGKHLVGDWRSGTIYEQSLSYSSDAGAQIRRLRAAPDLANGGKFTKYGELRLLADVGLGLDGAGVTAPAARAGRQFFSTRLPQYNISGFDYVDFGTPPALYINGDWSFGAWLNLPSNAHGAIVSYGAAGDTNPSGHFPYLVFLTPAGAGFNLCYSHDGGTSSAVVNMPYVTFAANLPANQWLYIGLSRSTAAQTVTLYVGDGVTLTAFATLPFTLPVNPTTPPNTDPRLLLGTCYQLYNAAPAPGLFNPESVILANCYMWAAQTAAADQFNAMLGNPPTAELVFDANAALTPVASVTALTGTLTGTINGTTLVGGNPIPQGGAPATNTGVDPQIVLQTSDDGGRTWGMERAASLGKLGEYRKLVRWRRNGRSNNRAFRVICTEAVRVALVACDLDSE